MRHWIINVKFVLSLCLVASTVSGWSAVAQSGPRRPLQLFLLVGQSNMAGRGVVEPSDRAAHPRVWMLDRAKTWVPAVEPMHFDKPIAGVGPGRAFGIAVADADPSIDVGLVPAAVGGSAITAWEPGAVHEQTGAKPYDDALGRAREASAAGTFKAVLWHQGETDATTKGAPEYERRLLALIERLRRDLGDPALPVLIGQLGRFTAGALHPSQVEIDAAHRRVAAAVNNAAFVSSEGLTHKGDGVHFDSLSARMLGRRYAEAFLRMNRSRATPR